LVSQSFNIVVLMSPSIRRKKSARVLIGKLKSSYQFTFNHPTCNTRFRWLYSTWRNWMQICWKFIVLNQSL